MPDRYLRRACTCLAKDQADVLQQEARADRGSAAPKRGLAPAETSLLTRCVTALAGTCSASRPSQASTAIHRECPSPLQ